MIKLILSKEAIFLPAEVKDIFWGFVRGDIPVMDFEKWVYSNENDLLRQILSDDSYTKLAMLDYNDENELNILAGSLYDFLVQFYEKCLCSTFSNNTVIYPFTGGIEEVALQNKIELLKVIAKFENFSGDHPIHQSRWYYPAELCCCIECKTQWLVIFDEGDSDYYLIRLNKEEASLIATFPIWPNKYWPLHLGNWKDFFQIEFQRWDSRYIEMQIVSDTENFLSNYHLNHLKISKDGKLKPRY